MIKGRKAIAAVMAGTMAMTGITPVIAVAETLKDDKVVSVTESNNIDKDNKEENDSLKSQDSPGSSENAVTEPAEPTVNNNVVEQPAEPDQETPATPTTPDNTEQPELSNTINQTSDSSQADAQTGPDIVPANSNEDSTTAPATSSVSTSDNNYSKLNNMMENYTRTENNSNASYTQHHYTANMTTEKFIASIGEEARQIGQEHNIYASVMIAQAILESGSGSSGLSQAPYNNLFGIKGVWTDKDGNKHFVNFNTQEDDGSGNLYTINDSFRAYNTTSDSLEDYARLLTDTENGMGNYYTGTWKSNTRSYEDACNALQGTYATDTSYASKLKGIIEAYDLTRFDEKLDYELDGEIYDPESKEADERGYRKLTMDDYAKLEAEVTSHLGTPYVWGGSNPEQGFDCSGLTSYVYNKVFGIDISRTADTQALKGEPVDFKDLRMGDLLFFADNSGVYHTGMYLGDGYYIQAPHEGDVVKITAMEDSKPTFARRILKYKNVDDSKNVEEAVDSSDDITKEELVNSMRFVLNHARQLNN